MVSHISKYHKRVIDRKILALSYGKTELFINLVLPFIRVPPLLWKSTSVFLVKRRVNRGTTLSRNDIVAKIAVVVDIDTWTTLTQLVNTRAVFVYIQRTIFQRQPSWIPPYSPSTSSTHTTRVLSFLSPNYRALYEGDQNIYNVI